MLFFCKICGFTFNLDKTYFLVTFVQHILQDKKNVFGGRKVVALNGDTDKNTQNLMQCTIYIY